ncbi:MAG: hypothetical protein HY394_00050 [Candidatus Diapherotrites archaeon]|nr:hypothetical protein [Candidatus Diapherotrites archaeon]
MPLRMTSGPGETRRPQKAAGRRLVKPGEARRIAAERRAKAEKRNPVYYIKAIPVDSEGLSSMSYKDGRRVDPRTGQVIYDLGPPISKILGEDHTRYVHILVTDKNGRPVGNPGAPGTERRSLHVNALTAVKRTLSTDQWIRGSANEIFAARMPELRGTIDPAHRKRTT